MLLTDDRPVKEAVEGALLPHHHEKLRSCGLLPVTARLAGLHSVTRPEEAAKILNGNSFPPELLPGLSIPYFDLEGRRMDGFARLRPDNPRTVTRKGSQEACKYEQPKGAAVRPYFPPVGFELLRDPEQPLIFTAGELKALKAAQEGFACVGLASVEAWSVRPKKDSKGRRVGSRELLPDLTALPLRGRRCYIAFDSDLAERSEVRRAETALAEELRRVGAEVFLVRLPAASGGEKQGLDDFLVARGADGLWEVLTKALPAHADARRVVVLSCSEHEATRLVTDALADDDRLFQRDGVLVRPLEVVRDDRPRLPGRPRSAGGLREPPGLTLLRPADLAYVRLRITQACRLMRPSGKDGELREAHPPGWLAPQVMSCPGRVRTLKGLLPGPTIDDRGRLIAEPGFDDETGWLLSRRLPGLELPERPDLEEARASAERLLALVGDFPFASDPDKVRWLVLLLTACARHLISRTPLGLIVANTQGSGKTLLARLIAMIAHGTDDPILMNWPDGGRLSGQSNEVRKRLASLLHEGAGLALIDNLPRGEDFGCPELDAFLTSNAYHDRELGRNDGRRVGGPNTCLLLATGNNVAPFGDTADRALVVRLRCDHPSPRSRPPEEFQVRDIETHVRQERALYLSAALTVWRAWILEGLPRPEGEHWGSFEELVAGPVAIVRWLGLGDPIEGRARAASEQDREGQALETLLSLWDRLFGQSPISCSELIRRLDGEAPSAEVQAARDALAALGVRGRWPYNGAAVGKALAGQADKPRDIDLGDRKARLRLARKQDTHTKSYCYSVVEDELRGLRGVAGVACHQPGAGVTGLPRACKEHAGCAAPPQPPATPAGSDFEEGVI